MAEHWLSNHKVDGSNLQFVYRRSILFFPLAKVGYGSWHLIPGGTENELWVTAPGDDLTLFVHEL